jgi:ubiquinone/menaquinone biosynthesis C-methylase UbiE
MSAVCKICGEKNNKLIGKPVTNDAFPRSSENNYKIFQCNNCGYYFVLPGIDLSQQEWQRLYENKYFAQANVTSWQKKLRDSERKKRFKHLMNSLNTEKGKFLDIGCGEGHVLQEAYSNGFEPYGVDIANNLSAEFSAFNFFNGNIIDAKFPDNFFSVVYMDSVLEHVMNPMETLHELNRILKPGGVLLLIVPNEDSLENSFIRLIYSLTFQSHKYGKIKPLVSPYHVQGYNATSLKMALSKSAFSKTLIKGFGGSYAFWKAAKINTVQFFQSLLTYPVGLLSILVNRQIQLMTISIKE